MVLATFVCEAVCLMPLIRCELFVSTNLLIIFMTTTFCHWGLWLCKERKFYVLGQLLWLFGHVCLVPITTLLVYGLSHFLLWVWNVKSVLLCVTR